MQSKKINERVTHLAAHLEPVRVISYKTLLFMWMILSLAVGSYYLMNVGARPDLSLKFGEAHFVAALFFFICFYLFSSVKALRLLYPGFAHALHGRAVIVGQLLFWVGVFLYAADSTPIDHTGHATPSLEAFGCCLRITFGAIPLALALSLAALRFYPQQFLLLSSFIWSAAAAVVCIVSQLNCPFDNLYHIVIGHGVMVWATGLLSSWVIAISIGFTTRFLKKHNPS